MIIFQSAYCYINSASDIKSKIDKVDQIISALLDTALKAVTDKPIADYMLNDGQTIIKTVYQSPEAIMRSIKELEKIREMYVEQYNRRNNGRTVRLLDAKSFIR